MRLAAFVASCRDELGWTARVADLGGGFGIRHHPDDDVPEAAELAASAASTARLAFVEAGLPKPEVWLEPGRCLVGPAGVTLYRVGSVKRLPGRTWAAIDGGMSDNPRPQLYDARYTALSAAGRRACGRGGQHRGDALRVRRRPDRRRGTPPHRVAATCSPCPRPARTRSRWPPTTTASPVRPRCSCTAGRRDSSGLARRSTTCFDTRSNDR